jgi:hypothetical protein
LSLKPERFTPRQFLVANSMADALLLMALAPVDLRGLGRRDYA